MSNDCLKLFPSLNTHKWDAVSHCWIQWKGSEICMDVHCACGFFGHFDGYDAYHIKCPKCSQVYECDGHITLHPIDFQPERTKLLEKEDDE